MLWSRPSTKPMPARSRPYCFVTGVPGAGKPLTGLNAIHDPDSEAQQKRPGVFLSGNGPLVKIVGAALVRDASTPAESSRNTPDARGRHADSKRAFVDHAVHEEQGDDFPSEHVIVFDEAQRAWNAEQVKKKKRPFVKI